MSERRNGFTHKIKREIREAQDGCCAFCGDQPDVLEVHHIQPLCKGGGNDPENGVGLCPEPCHDTMDRLAIKYDFYYDQVLEEGIEYTVGLLNSVPQ